MRLYSGVQEEGVSCQLYPQKCQSRHLLMPPRFSQEMGHPGLRHMFEHCHVVVAPPTNDKRACVSCVHAASAKKAPDRTTTR